MTYKIVASTAAKPRGDWRYKVSANGHTVWSTTATEAVAVVINTEQPETYLSMSDEDAFLERFQFALSCGKMQKAFIQALSIDSGTMDGEELAPLIAYEPTDAELNAMACGIDEPVVGLPDNTWHFDDYPLIVFAPHYAPYSDIPLPMGANVVVIDPTDERTFLMSLADVGIFKAEAF